MTRPWWIIGRVLKWGGNLLGSLVLLALVLFAATFAINWRHESLAPETQALLQPPSNPYQPEDNLYLAMAGLDAPPGESVIAAGQANVDYYNQRLDAQPPDPLATNLDRLTRKDPRRLDFKGDCKFVRPLESSLWDDIAQHREEVEKLLADNPELYQRYLALFGLRGYYETERPSYVAPLFVAFPSQVRKLFLADVALRMRSGVQRERERALADLQSDVRMWRAVLTGQGTLVSEMVSVAYLQSDYLLLADMIADGHTPLPESEKDGESLVPVFDLKDWDLGATFAAEFRLRSAFFRQTNDLYSRGSPGGETRSAMAGWMNRLWNRISWHFFKINATENLLARQTARRMLAVRDPATFYRARKAPRGWLLEDQSLWTLLLSYNPTGKVLAGISDSVFDEYPLRAWDGAALQRLVRAGYEIRRQRIETASIPSFLQQHPEWSTHPADGRPFLWDAGSGELRVQTVGRQPPGRRFSIRLWQRASGG